MKARLTLVVTVLVAASLLLASCAPAAVTETVAATEEVTYPEAPEYIEIGASIPRNGSAGPQGVQVETGYNYAIDTINAAGGVFVAEYNTSIQLRLTAYDDESDPTKVTANLERVLSEKDVVAILGGATTPLHSAAIAVAQTNEIPYLGVSFAWWNIHQRGYDYLFSPFPKSPAQAVDVFKALNDLIPVAADRPTKVAIFQENTDWGRELGGLWNANAKPFGYTVVYNGIYTQKTTSFTTLIQEAQAAGADMLLALPISPDAATLIKDMQALDWAPKFSLLIRAPDSATWPNLGTAGDYVTVFAGWHNGEKFPGVAEINARHQTDFGRPADILVGPGYACVQILADAIRRAGTLDRQDIRDAIADTDMMTVIGPVSFNADGTGVVLNPLVQWQNGKMELVWPLDMATATFLYPAPAYADR
jgi:branched-chain amino acid transport system substrate-binding protein